MSETTWTPAQEEALSARGGNLLLAAAAGSGKTAVLVERVIRRITDPADPVPVNEFLILTFTRTAASEMRSRISAALSGAIARLAESCRARPNKTAMDRMAYLEKQLALLPSASISTIDAFCQSVLRQYFYLLDIAPDFRILSDENEKYLLQDDVLSEVLLRWYDGDDPAFSDLADLFAANYQDARLRDTVLRLYSFSRSLAFPEEFLRRLSAPYSAPGKTPDGLPWAEPLLEDFRSQVLSWQAKYRRIFELLEEEPAFQPYSDPLGEEFSAFSVLLSPDAKSWSDWHRIMNQELFQRFKSVSKKQAADPIAFDWRKAELQSLRNSVKKDYQEIAETYFSVPPAQWMSDMEAAAPLADALARLTLDFSSAYARRKSEEGLLEFNDMEHLVLRLLLTQGSTPGHLCRSETALALQRKYREVMVDEYQDTNSLQEFITLLISNGQNRFLVGDLKQSIYRFRQADPSIFLEKYETFRPEDPDNRLIGLNRNFRSDASVLSAANFIFRQLLRKEDGRAPLELDYGDAEALVPGRNTGALPAGHIAGAADILLIDRAAEEAPEDGDEDAADPLLDKTEAEARLIARTIGAFLREKKLVTEKDGSFRPIACKDIVILLRSVESKAPVFLRTLREAGIPAVCSQQDDFFSAPEVQILLSLLKILDNPRQDLALTAVLRSPVAGLSEESLARLRLADRDLLWNALPQASSLLSSEQALRVIRFLALYRTWRPLARQGGVAPLIDAILKDTDFLSYFSGMAGSAFRRAHIRSFCESARAWDSDAAGGLCHFLMQLSAIEKTGRSIRQEVPAQSEGDAVRIMTIHKSKGLEFPVVFLAASGNAFNLKDTRSFAVWDKDRGLGLYRFDRDRHCCWPTLYSYAVKQSIRRQTLAEEARLLYVAMTRAKDKLIITGTVRDMDASLRRWTQGLAGSPDRIPPLPPYTVTGAVSYLDWIMPAVLRSRSLAALWERSESIPAYIPGDASFSCAVYPIRDFLTEEEKRDSLEEPDLSKAFLTAPEGPFPDWIDRRFRWTYAHGGAVSTPAKLTATAAVQLMESDKEEDAPSVLLAPPLPEKQPLPEDFTELPDFLRGDEGKDRGTAYGTLMHKAMELLDLSQLPPEEAAISEAIRKLSEGGVFTAEETAVLLGRKGRRRPVSDILAFLRSPLGALMQNAGQIRKEMPFSILLPARDFYPDCEEGESLFLQGAVDCLLETDGALIIIDYKTDRTEDPEALRSHYRIQLQIYGKALAAITGKPVRGLYLWSFHLHQALPVPLS